MVAGNHITSTYYFPPTSTNCDQMNLRFSSPDGGFAFIQIITEDGYIVYRYSSEDDNNRSMPWLETYEIEGEPDDEDVLAVLPDGFAADPQP